MSTKDTTLTVKLPKKLRDDAKKTAGELGIPLTTAVTALLRQFAREKELTLSAKIPNKETREAIAELRAGKGTRYSGTAKDIFDKMEKEEVKDI